MFIKYKLFLSALLFIFSLSTNADSGNVLRIATTTSTENSGLLAVLHPSFEHRNKARIDVIAVGTGKALKLGENGDVDVVFVHAPKAEIAFVQLGFGTNRHAVMHNDFIIIGPPNDPANIKQANCIEQALKQLDYNRALFVSRGDNSGTHKKELSLWANIDLTPKGKHYISVGQDMGATLRIADDKQAYTLTDRGTYLAHRHKLDLSILFEGGPALFNPYHVIAVNPDRHTHVNSKLTELYINYLISEKTQKIIADYQLFGQQLFYPDAK